MRVHKLNNVEQAMDLLEKHKVYLILSLCHVSCYGDFNAELISQRGGVSGRRVEGGVARDWSNVLIKLHDKVITQQIYNDNPAN